MQYKFVALTIEQIDGLKPECDVMIKKDHIVISIKGDKKLYREPSNLRKIIERLQKGDIFAEPLEFELDGRYGTHALSWSKYVFRFCDNYLHIIESFYDLNSAITVSGTFDVSGSDTEPSYDAISTESSGTSTDISYVSTKTKTTEVFITKSIRLDLETCIRKIIGDWSYGADDAFHNDDGCSMI